MIIYYRQATLFDSLEYLPLHRIKGGVLKCDKCDLKVDSRVAHLYLFYIMEGVDKVGVVFEYSSACVNQLGLGLSVRGPPRP